MKYRVEIEESTVKVFFVDAMNPADALAKAKNDGGMLRAIRSNTHTETFPVDDRGNQLEDRPMRCC